MQPHSSAEETHSWWGLGQGCVQASENLTECAWPENLFSWSFNLGPYAFMGSVAVDCLCGNETNVLTYLKRGWSILGLEEKELSLVLGVKESEKEPALPTPIQDNNIGKLLE